MKKYILKSLFVSVLCMLAASCQDTEFAEAVDSSKAQVMFSIAMDSPAARSRANWGQDYSQTSDLGDEYDNRIDLDQFIVKIEADGKTYNVTDIIKWKEGESNEHKFVGIVKTQNDENVGDITLQKAKISVYANMGTDANANFASMTFDQDAENIPMWGALTVENLKFAPGKRTSVDDIYLLRAMAKFQVTLGDAAIEKGYTLTKASLNKFNLTGFNMPTGYAGAESTMALDMEGVLNENTTNPAGGVTELTEATEDGKGWVIYLPEISNTTASELKMLLTFSNGSNEKIETEVSVKDYTTANTGLVNIVRNHWYKYVIEDIVNAKPVVKYETLDWEPINIEVGGEGFLYLNKDVIEIFNTNVEPNQLTFSSSSPIVSIKLKDVYNHVAFLDKFETYLDGTDDENKDNTYAYYINKYGNKIQLGTDIDYPETQDFENIILSNIKANYPHNVTNGNIEIYSPFVADPTNENTALQNDSHYNAVRYLEFEVTNKQGLTANFRVEQYPAVVVTNEEGYFSYRDDFHPDYNILTKDEEASHFKNFKFPGYSIACYHNFDYHVVDPNKIDREHEAKGYVHDYHVVDGCKATSSGYYRRELALYANCGYGWYKPLVAPLVEFERAWWGTPLDGHAKRTLAVTSAYYDPNFKDPDPQDQAKAQALMNEGRGGWWRKHYTGNLVEFFCSKVVHKIWRTSTTDNGYGYARAVGEADMWYYMTNSDKNGWSRYRWIVDSNLNSMQYTNNRMYHIKTRKLTGEYTIGFPTMVDEAGNATNDAFRGVVVENSINENMVSPSFMVASQLGETIMPVEEGGYYELPYFDYIYEMAKTHCKEYVETTFVDESGDGMYQDGEPLKHYRDWRLPTKKEIELIIDYQNISRAMDVVLTGEKYICIKEDLDNCFAIANPNPDNKQDQGYFIRCVRDVRSEENNNN